MILCYNFYKRVQEDKKVNELEKNICQLQDMIVVMTQLFLSGKVDESVKQYPIFTKAIEVVLVDMMQEYQSRGVGEYIPQIEYWKNQLPRIMEAIESEDYFRVIDTLYFETRENLENLNKMLSEKV